MGLENIIRTLSKWVAGAVVFFIAAGFYLAAKGFEMGPDGTPVLVNSASAAIFSKSKPDLKKVDENFALPTGRFLGREDAPVTIYEYSSFGCTHCADFHLNTLDKIKKEFIDTGKVRVLFVPFPLDKKSMMVAMVSECVADDKYHEFVSLMLKKQREWGYSSKSEKIIAQYAALSGIGAQEFEKCIKDENAGKVILSDRQYGIDELGIKGTPSIVIANKNMREIHYGAPSYSDLKVMINKMLDDANKVNESENKKAEK